MFYCVPLILSQTLLILLDQPLLIRLVLVVLCSELLFLLQLCQSLRSFVSTQNTNQNRFLSHPSTIHEPDTRNTVILVLWRDYVKLEKTG